MGDSYLELSSHFFLNELPLVIQFNLSPVWHFLGLFGLHVLTNGFQPEHLAEPLESRATLTELFILPSNLDGFQERFQTAFLESWINLNRTLPMSSQHGE